ncbi:unnamed protein product [Phyllotreta striolata]|uniref:C2H2-type domain-containing protein n=1 Tax=Phyllotreta striolata TaxID=444603 RepID=A0A9N9TMU2_PHYSR|nr:unnamed protein product [Phyllotreta striolata]
MYPCLYCNKYFNSENGIRNHIETIHSARNIKFTTVKLFQSSDNNPPTNLNQNIKTLHTNVTSVTSELGPQLFQTPTNLKPQPATKGTKPKTATTYPCSLCTKVFPTSAQLFQHKEDKHKITSFECTSCSQFFKALKDLEQHKASKHGDTKQDKAKSKSACLLCSQVFKDAVDLEKHKATMHCSIPSTNPSVLAHQLIQLASSQLIRNDTKPKNVCILCSQSFQEPEHLEQHSIAKHGVSSIVLNNVHQNQLHKARSLSSLNNIGFCQNVVTAPAQTNIIRCIYCPKKCKTLLQLDQHNNDVHKNKNYFPCHFCAKPFDADLKRTGHLKQVHNFAVQQ